jgi:hypothetical protein
MAEKEIKVNEAENKPQKAKKVKKNSRLRTLGAALRANSRK